MPDRLDAATLRDIITLGTIHEGHGPDAARAMAAELLALRDFVDRYRKTWTGAHGDYDRTATRQGRAGCLVCEADRRLGGRTE